jgi:lipopolysaccharide export system protein LptA
MRGRLAVFLVLGAAPLAAQQPERCRIAFSTSGTGGFSTTPEGETRWASGNVRLACVGQDVRVTTDSAVLRPGGDVEFVGRVRYRDTTVTIAADRATFRRATETWEARGNVAIQNLETGSTVVGPSVDYLRAAAGVRDSAEVYATGRPKVNYFSDDSLEAPDREPYKIVADRLRSRGKSLVWAGGRVTVDRSDLSAHADSMRLDTGPADNGSLLGGKPEFRGLGADSFLIRGARIDFTLEHRQVSGVLAQREAHVEREDWALDADTIALAIHERRVRQINAWGREHQADGASDRYALRGDSVIIETPEQRLSGLRAFGKGWVAGAVDSTTGERNWLSGDTVIATFAADSADTSSSRLTRLEAYHDARSFQRLEPEHPGEKPGLSYVRAEAIVVRMKPSGTDAVERVDATGSVQGVQLDPAKGS